MTKAIPATAVLDSQGRVYLPRGLRRKMGWHERQELQCFSDPEGGLVLRP